METIMYPTERKATREHVCNFCSEKITLGKTYLKSTHKNDGGIYDFKTHVHCAELATRLKMYDDADEGVTDEIFSETVSEEYYSLITEIFTRDESILYRDVLQELRYVKWNRKLSYVLRHYAKIDKKENIEVNPKK